MVDALFIPAHSYFHQKPLTNLDSYHFFLQPILHLIPDESEVAWANSMRSGQSLINNWYADIRLMSLNGKYYPIGIGKTHHQQTYLGSATNGYIDYARDELDLIKDTKTRLWAGRSLNIAEPWMRSLSLDRAISVNAWGVSTHLYPDWDKPTVKGMTQSLTTQYPDRPLWMRTLNSHQQAPLMRHLVETGWQLWPNRQVYLFDPKHASDWGNRRNNQIDQKLIRHTPLIRCNHEDLTNADAPIMANLYAQLYLHKHSAWNAHYSAEYFRLAIKHHWIKFLGFRNETGKLVAFIGIYDNEKSMTTPMLGYDTTLPQTLGLYRLLMGSVMRLALDNQQLLNLGAGASSFKKMRGGQAEIEWHAFYTNHLSTVSRLKMNTTRWIMQKTVPSFLAEPIVTPPK